ncbi:TetR/AcrR family transcriptional regulator [Metabacillus malikii]|uniref:AcrR family transcriptional regulator n=1 Tax=Metabacillus malikii TaxID=1504265 RepID=A0ABT9ZBK1_9BACI|nr:TetR/AcrR family transcriptional regulator [Metabacillus malikii]MDQ0228978.1 AcrR family transcriptional regulator [Metabacillus malikii]
MPKVTYHNLPDDKKQKLIDAAKQEFSRVPLYKASISNIVKTAKIPRGSFYQYFEDKDDLYYYLLNELVQQLNGVFISLLKKNKGNLFDALVDFFTLMIAEEDHFYLLKNSFLNMTYKVENYFLKIFNQNHQQMKNVTEISHYIDVTMLNSKNDDEFLSLIKILSSITFHNFVERFANNVTNEKALAKYKTELDLVKRGLAKN